MSKKKKLIIGAAAAVILIAAVVIVLILNSRNKMTASTMRLLQIKGEVTLESGGKKKEIIENIKLNSGDILSTAVDSLASISLDDNKMITLEEESEAEFKQNGKKLDLNLKKGSLYFAVDKKLADDETFEIRYFRLCLC